MKNTCKTTQVLLARGLLTFILVFTLVSHVSAQNMIFTNRAAFEAAAGSSPVLLENFDSFANGQQVTQLFGGVITFASPFPTIFFGNWNLFGTGGQFSGGAIIPESRFQGKSLVLNFSSPVFGVGGNAFDDFDGTPFVNVITLTVTTSLGTTFSISETAPNVGDTGFLGATSPQGIVQAAFSIDNTNGNLEVDLLTVVPQRPVTSVEIDIKPGGFPNSVNPRTQGVIPVAVLTTGTFDATTVDPTTVRFGRTGTEAAPVQSALKDVDLDGDMDLILHFNIQDTGIVCGDTSASLTGETFGGQAIKGSDSINTVGC